MKSKFLPKTSSPTIRSYSQLLSEKLPTKKPNRSARSSTAGVLAGPAYISPQTSGVSTRLISSSAARLVQFQEPLLPIGPSLTRISSPTTRKSSGTRSEEHTSELQSHVNL